MFLQKLMKCAKKGHYVRVTLEKDLFDNVTVTKSWWGELKPGGFEIKCTNSEEKAMAFINDLTDRLTKKNRGYVVIEEKVFDSL